MPVTVLRSLLPAVPGEDAAAELFGILHREYRDAPAAFLDSSDHARTPQPHRSRYSVLAFSLGEAAEVVIADQGRLGGSAFSRTVTSTTTAAVLLPLAAGLLSRLLPFSWAGSDTPASKETHGFSGRLMRWSSITPPAP